MSGSREGRIDAVFEAALAMEAAERAAWLAELEAADPALVSEVRKMLGAHELEDGVLDRPAPAELGPDTPGVERRAVAGRRGADRSGGRRRRVLDLPGMEEEIGRYRVVRRLGLGGMGDVYLAVQREPFHRQVAIKVLRRGAEDGDALRRFDMERQVMASLNHPNIAALLDGGVTSEGLPFLVMEYVEGQPITEFCDERQLGVDARIRLFLDVCEGLDHAHRNLVLHRDLKPAHMLVTPAGEVKLLDFGIAKLLNAALGAAAGPLTFAGGAPMTPLYASPEQVAGRPLNTASDVYSLGVVLYELVCGVHPAEAPTDADGPTTAPPSAEPHPPATRYTRLPEAERARIAAARGTDTETLRRALSGDLATVLLTALRPEPGRRYGSAQLLAADLRSLLEGLPVSARPNTFRYRAGRFLGRHRWSAAAAALLLLALAGGVVATLWQASIASAERARAEAALADVDQALGESRAVTDFLLALFEASDVGEARGREVTARDLLERGEARIDLLAGRPLAQARLLQTLGSVTERLGDPERAESHLRRALAAREAALGADHPDVAETLTALGWLHARADRYEEAARLQERALRIRLDRFGERDSLVAESYANLAYARTIPDPRDAVPLYRRALEIRRQVLGPTHPTTLESLERMGAISRRIGDLDQAERYFAAAVRGDDGRPAAERNMTFPLQLADLIRDQPGRLDEARALYVEAAEILRARPGTDPLYPRSLRGLSRVAEADGDFAEAERLRRAGDAADRRLFGDRHPVTAANAAQLGAFLRRAGRLDAAAAALDSARTLAREIVGPNSDAEAWTLVELGGVHVARGDLEAAESLVRSALDMVGEGGGYPHYLLRLAEILAARGEVGPAREAYDRALALLRVRSGPTHPDVVNAERARDALPR